MIFHMNRFLLFAIIIIVIAAGSLSVLAFGAGTSPVYSVPELSTMMDNLTSRVTILETQIVIDETKEAQDFATVQTEYDDLREYVIPDYTKLPIIKLFSATHTTEPYREVISTTFTIQAFYDGERTQVSCYYQGSPGHQLVIDHELGLTTFTHDCFYSIGITNSIMIKFDGAINQSYVIPLNP